MNSEDILPRIAQFKDIPAPFPCRYIAATGTGWEYGTAHAPANPTAGKNERRKLGTTPCEHAAYNWLSTGVAPT